MRRIAASAVPGFVLFQQLYAPIAKYIASKMANLRGNPNSGDRPQYKTPKPYDYAQAVRETAPKHPGNVAGDSPQFVKASKIAAARGEVTQGNKTRGQGTRGNKTRGKETRENMTRGKVTRKKGAGERDATKKGAAETRRSGRENTGAPALNNLPDLDSNIDPNLRPNIDPNLDPELEGLGLILHYNMTHTSNSNYHTAPSNKDEPGIPQRTDWQDPEDIGDGNRPLNSEQTPR